LIVVTGGDVPDGSGYVFTRDFKIQAEIQAEDEPTPEKGRPDPIEWIGVVN
jgi:hypothetical protein